VQFFWYDYAPSMDAFSTGKVDAVGMTKGDALVTGSGGKPSVAIIITDFSSGIADVPSPLAIGTLRLQDGQLVKWFLCESVAAQYAEDISQFGGWRKYLEKVARPGSGE